MGRNRTITPTTDHIEISDGDWISIKRDLNTGEQKQLEAAGLKPPVMLNGQPFSPIDWSVYELERALIFLTDWSLCGADNKKLPLNFASMAALDVDSFDEINRAILKHVLKRAAEKKAMREAAAMEKEAAKQPPALNLLTDAVSEPVPTSI